MPLLMTLPSFVFFFCIELAAAIPRTEIVGKSEYFRFGMRDSLAIEASFLQVIPFELKTQLDAAQYSVFKEIK